MEDIAYNIVLFGATCICWLACRAQPRAAILLGSVLVTGMTAVLLASMLGRDQFGFMRLVAYSLFLQLPVGLAGVAFLWRKKSLRSSIALVAVAVLLSIVAVDAFFVEPHWLDESELTLGCEGIKTPLRIVVLADFQTDRFGEYERHVLRRCLEHDPDLLLLAGDYLQLRDTGGWQDLRRQFNAYLREIGFGEGCDVFAVTGNTDRGSWTDIFDGLPVTRVRETSRFRTNGVTVTCLSVEDSFDTGLKVEGQPDLHIVLGHSPNFALGDVNAELLVAGHTHGGQVRLPGIGPLITKSKIPRSWAAGITQLSGDRKLIVSRGTGMERLGAPPLRFLCRPQLIILELMPAA